MDQYFRDPMSAGAIAAAVTAAYIYFRGQMNSEKLKNSDYFKPAFLVGLLVYLIVAQGAGQGPAVTQAPF
jgi:ABC-type tungstate transport system substrate-binding protein